jgi:chromosome segregation ATPase
MATRRQLRARVAELAARDLVRLDRIAELEKALRTASAPRVGVTPREVELADRVVRLERELKQARTGAPDVPRELAALRRQLAVTQKQLDDATRTGDVGLLTVRPRPADKGAVTG